MPEGRSIFIYALLATVAICAAMMFLSTEHHVEDEVMLEDQSVHQIKAPAIRGKAAKILKGDRVHGAAPMHLSESAKIKVVKKPVSVENRAPVKVDAAERKRLQTLIQTVSQSYKTTEQKAKEMAESVKKTAHAHSAALQHNARTKAATVMFKAKKALRKSLKALQTTLTQSVDQRERAAHQLEKLKQESHDEVVLAQAALEVARVNKETNLANAVARAAAKKAHAEASATMKTARRTLASRLKAIKNTELLTVKKAQLQANVVMTESKFAVSKAKQDALLELEDLEPAASLEQIVGKDAVVSDPQDTQPSQFSSDLAISNGMSDTDLLDSHVDDAGMETETIYTAKMGVCKFPFVYNGEKLFHCKSSAQGSWCATHTDDASHEVKKWDYCVQNNKVVKVAKEAAMQAAKLEIKRVLVATGGQNLSPAALRESLRAAAAAKKVQRDTTPKISASEEGLKGQPTVMGEDKATKTVDSLIAAGH
jgi:hypothetical protein